MRCWAALLVVAGCYSPSLREGAPCERSDQCPVSQRCVLGSCSTHDAATDAPAPDAAIDAPIDAPHLACSTAGLSCGNNLAVSMFTCAGNCWVHCVSRVAYAT